MAYRVYERVLKRSQQDCFELFKHLSRQPSLRSEAGSFFEGYVHDWFRSGDVDDINDNKKLLGIFSTVKCCREFKMCYNTLKKVLIEWTF